MVDIKIVGWRPGFKSISFIKLIRNSGLDSRSLPEAKDLVDHMIVGTPFAVRFVSESEADAFVAAAEELGAMTSRLGSDGDVSGGGLPL